MEVWYEYFRLTSSVLYLMVVLKVSKESIQRALEILAAGGVVIHATETCYGIACDLTNPKAVAHLFAVKKRPETQPVSAHFSSIDQAKQYGVFSERALSLAKKYLPGPLTIVVPLQLNPPTPIFLIPPTPTPTQTLGVRLSPHPVAIELSEKFGKPLATTSANLHSLPNPYSVSDIQTQWKGQSPEPDLVLDSGEIPKIDSSTVVEVIGENIRVLRQGSINIPISSL